MSFSQVYEVLAFAINQSINQSIINQSINQSSINQSINQSIKGVSSGLTRLYCYDH